MIKVRFKSYVLQYAFFLSFDKMFINIKQFLKDKGKYL